MNPWTVYERVETTPPHPLATLSRTIAGRLGLVPDGRQYTKYEGPLYSGLEFAMRLRSREASDYPAWHTYAFKVEKVEDGKVHYFLKHDLMHVLPEASFREIVDAVFERG